MFQLTQALKSNQESFEIHFVEHSACAEDAEDILLLDPKIMASKSLKRRLHHISGRRALSKISFARDGDVLQIVHGAGGCLTRDGQIFARFSISHSDYGAVAAVAPPDVSVGVDLEPKNRRISQGALNLILNEEEQNELHDEPSRLRMWMSKEAISKALGIGLSISKEITYDGRSWLAKGSRWSVDSQDITISEVDHILIIAQKITEET
tara:strand:+ start:120 stop:746 length:627 start_codon:yes stop_codon:yes gene_type:complete